MGVAVPGGFRPLPCFTPGRGSVSQADGFQVGSRHERIEGKYREGRLFLDHTPGHAGEYVDPHEYPVVTREPDHPIMRGLPRVWLHGTDELYSNQRGPATNMTILATAWSDPAREAHRGVRTHGTGDDEPMVHISGWVPEHVRRTPESRWLRSVRRIRLVLLESVLASRCAYMASASGSP